MLVAIEIDTAAEQRLADTGLQTVTFVVVEEVVVFIPIIFLVSVAKAVVPLGGVAIAGEGKVGVGGVYFAGIEQTPGLPGTLLVVIQGGFCLGHIR